MGEQVKVYLHNAICTFGQVVMGSLKPLFAALIYGIVKTFLRQP